MITDPDLLAIVADLTDAERFSMALRLAVWSVQLSGLPLIAFPSLPPPPFSPPATLPTEPPPRLD